MLIIKDIVHDTFTNAAGFVLFTALKLELDKSAEVLPLSFAGVTSTSSSFLNSSIGAIADDYGLDILKRIKPMHVGATQSEILKKYIFKLKIQSSSRKLL